MPSSAATTTGMCSGRQPAITALIATFSAVIATWRLVMKAIWRVGLEPDRVEHRAHRRLGGRNHRQPVGPAPAVAEVERLLEVLDGVAL